jgi:hypothetical protein
VIGPSDLECKRPLAVGGRRRRRRLAGGYLSKRAEEEELRHDGVNEDVVEAQLLLPRL